MNNTAEKGRRELASGCDFYENEALNEACTKFQIAARLGNPEAQVNLANMLASGEGVKKDFKKAVYWYKKAVKLGMPEAAYNLAIAYRQQQNITWFKFWLTRASSMGDVDAKEVLMDVSNQKQV